MDLFDDEEDYCDRTDGDYSNRKFRGSHSPAIGNPTPHHIASPPLPKEKIVKSGNNNNNNRVVGKLATSRINEIEQSLSGKRNQVPREQHRDRIVVVDREVEKTKEVDHVARGKAFLERYSLPEEPITGAVYAEVDSSGKTMRKTTPKQQVITGR